MNDIIKTNLIEFRNNIKKYITESAGKTIYIYKRKRLVAELRVYTEYEIKKAEYRLLKKIVETRERGCFIVAQAKKSLVLQHLKPAFSPGIETSQDIPAYRPKTIKREI